MNEMSFENSFARLEEILEKINSGKTTLEESLSLYEEADKLILACNKKLSEAEQKVEVLIKSREGQLSLGADGKPQAQEFSFR